MSNAVSLKIIIPSHSKAQLEMSSVAKQLKFLNKISFTTKEAQIHVNPAKYSAIKLTFQAQNHNGHMGARKFWREYLPTIQFYNPGLKIDVVRVRNDNTKLAGVPCVLEILSNDNKVVGEIDMRNKRDDKIMGELLEKLDFEAVSEDGVVKV